jgi:hypothetical protein
MMTRVPLARKKPALPNERLHRGTLAAWMHDCLMSASNEAPVSAGGGWIRESVVRFRADYKRHVNEQRRDLERFARDAQREAARFQREAATFSISFTPSGSNALTLTLAWADKTWSVDLSGAR